MLAVVFVLTRLCSALYHYFGKPSALVFYRVDMIDQRTPKSYHNISAEIKDMNEDLSWKLYCLLVFGRKSFRALKPDKLSPTQFLASRVDLPGEQ